MALYEHILIARQDVSSAQVETLVEDLTKIVADNGGSIVKTEYWGLRNLAYRIQKNRKGHYVLMHIDAPHAAVAEMERNLRLNEDIIRTLTLRKDELPESPSIMMQVKAAREERARREVTEGRRRDRDGYGDRDEFGAEA
ncbi:30S ribosomal protein S6 [Zavarzinia compransoris]|uniref:Small ribosomal subunit protein bS6 n=1 Tax=Zavarzinia compransoris TaxID=1264899 RepID=A0A317DZB9_9PROT|nr:30S ribosomal protein S6 [Zavarzinia compransoris]TDP44820.1 SSU ribosomal protein S6P [Zavarzinia compransoris]